MDRKFFPEGWIGKEAIDHLRVICRILRFRELTCCWDRGWKSDEILVYTTSKSCLVRRLGGTDAPRLKICQDEEVDRIGGPIDILN